MKKLLYAVALLMVLGWIAGAFFFPAGKLIHVLLIVGAIAAMQAVMICPAQPARRTA